MSKRYAWIALALGSSVGSSAYAQQTYDADEPGAPTTGEHQQHEGSAAPGQAQPQQPGAQQQPGIQQPPSVQQQQPSGAAQAAPDVQQTAGADSAARRSQLQADGVRLSQLDQQQVMELQQSLQQAGYYTAEIDGLVGPKTKQALRRFYSEQAQLAAQGMILPAGAAALGLDQAEIERVSGQEEQEGGTDQQPARTPGGGTYSPQGGGATGMPSPSPSGTPSEGGTANDMNEGDPSDTAAPEMDVDVDVDTDRPGTQQQQP
jgi:hypothetical protein